MATIESELIKSFRPVGSVERLIQIGLDPKLYATCSPPVDQGGSASVRPCPVWAACPFNDPDRGGFKRPSALPLTQEQIDAGIGRPHNVPVFIGSYGGQMETFLPCYLYVSKVLPRENAQERTGETIEQLGGEGDEITMIVTLPEEPIKCNKSGNTRMISAPVTVAVPEFPDPADRFRVTVLSNAIHERRRQRVTRKRLERLGVKGLSEEKMESLVKQLLAEEEKSKDDQNAQTGKPAARRGPIKGAGPGRSARVPTGRSDSGEPAGTREGGDAS